MAVRIQAGLPLSDRESEVARLVAEGLTDRQIASRLFISERTVHAHLRAAFAKTGARNRVLLVVWLAAHGQDVLLVNRAGQKI
jgi:DNA-binding CsgD family transcriptional regulator